MTLAGFVPSLAITEAGCELRLTARQGCQEARGRREFESASTHLKVALLDSSRSIIIMELAASCCCTILRITPMDFNSFLSDTIATVLGGAVLTFLFFLAKEKLFPLPEVAGRWYFETRTVETAYKPFAGMVLRYVAMIWQEGPVIRGTVEKIYEKSSTGEREYVGKDRTRGTLEGHIEKFYLSKDRIRIHLVEDGFGREFTVIFDLVSKNASAMSGSFQSMAADQTGLVKWQRNLFLAD